MKIEEKKELLLDIDSYNRSIVNTKVELSKNINHVLHFFLSVLTFGVWLFIWVYLTVVDKNEKVKLNAKLGRLRNRKNDLETKLKSETKQDDKEEISKTGDSTDKLIELGKLFEKELITKEEFEDEKKKILES